MSRLKKKYHEKVKPALQKKFEYSNVMLIPQPMKVVISMGVGDAVKDRNAIQDCSRELAMIAGQLPLVCKAKKSVSNFKLREGFPIGLKVTLRGVRMYEFLDRFINVVSPRIRDFRGFDLKCDGKGNYSLGLDDQQIFPEVDLNQVKRTQGMHVTIVTSAETDDECRELLAQLGLPFKKVEKRVKAA